MSVGRTSLVILYIRKQYQNIFKKQYPRHPYIPFHDLFFSKHFLPSDITYIYFSICLFIRTKAPWEHVLCFDHRYMPSDYRKLSRNIWLIPKSKLFSSCHSYISYILTICRIIIIMSYIRCLIHVTVLMFISEHSVLIFISSWFPRPVTSTLKFVF